MSDIESLRERVRETEERLSKAVQVKDGNIVVNCGYDYKIPLDECADYPSLMGWVFQLCEKTWITVEVLERFIYVATRHHGLEVNR